MCNLFESLPPSLHSEQLRELWEANQTSRVPPVPIEGVLQTWQPFLALLQETQANSGPLTRVTPSCMMSRLGWCVIGPDAGAFLFGRDIWHTLGQGDVWDERACAFIASCTPAFEACMERLHKIALTHEVVCLNVEDWRLMVQSTSMQGPREMRLKHNLPVGQVRHVRITFGQIHTP